MWRWKKLFIECIDRWLFTLIFLLLHLRLSLYILPLFVGGWFSLLNKSWHPHDLWAYLVAAGCSQTTSVNNNSETWNRFAFHFVHNSAARGCQQLPTYLFLFQKWVVAGQVWHEAWQQKTKWKSKTKSCKSCYEHSGPFNVDSSMVGRGGIEKLKDQKRHSKNKKERRKRYCIECCM